MLKGRRYGRYVAKRRAETGFVRPCLTPECHREAGLGLAGYCRKCAATNLEIMNQGHGGGGMATA